MVVVVVGAGVVTGPKCSPLMRPRASTARLTKTSLMPLTVATKVMAVAVLEVTESSERLFTLAKLALSDAVAGAGRAARKARSKCATTCDSGIGW